MQTKHSLPAPLGAKGRVAAAPKILASVPPGVVYIRTSSLPSHPWWDQQTANRLVSDRNMADVCDLPLEIRTASYLRMAPWLVDS